MFTGYYRTIAFSTVVDAIGSLWVPLESDIQDHINGYKLFPYQLPRNPRN